jgi:threonine/homoserine/homoserine lactone efflux protein
MVRVFDARYAAFATISALLVVSPGATMAVVLESALAGGRISALLTVIGVNIGNSSLALGSALGMSIVFHRWPWTLQFVKGGGAAYLTYLGLRAVWRAYRPPVAASPVAVAAGAARGASAGPTGPGGGASYVTRGIMTNLLNPPVVLFYMTFLPQFIGPRDPFFTRFIVLAATHVSMSLVWLTTYATALGVLADRMARPMVRRSLEGVTGVVLVGFGVRLLFR